MDRTDLESAASPSASQRRRPAAPCPACGDPHLQSFYRVEDVPVNSVLRISSPEEARSFPTGDLDLALCPKCGFITNRAFAPTLVRYDREYDGTQAFSPTFNAFHEHLARDLIERYDLHGKRIVEIGCGQGEFLHLLARLGDNRGLGFDPACVTAPSDPRVEIIADEYSAAHADVSADFLCCKMTLEHIPDVASFVRTVRKTVGDNPNTAIFFQVPDAGRLLDDGAFWDVYYEHCSYFTATSLAALFRQEGFRVQSTWTAYDGQYLMIEAHPRLADNPPAPESDAPVRSPRMQNRVEAFARSARTQQTAWTRWLHAEAEAGHRVVLWGGGSKAVAFLTSLGVDDEIAYVVDVNPHKHNTYLAGTGHPIVGPGALPDRPPDTVVVMNPVYVDEIRSALERQGLSPHLTTVESLPLSEDASPS